MQVVIPQDYHNIYTHGEVTSSQDDVYMYIHLCVCVCVCVCVL